MTKNLYDSAIAVWKTSTRQTAEWVPSTAELALVKRHLSLGTILHSDHGSNYTSYAYRECLRWNGLKISMGRVRTCAGNASAESVFGLLKRELVNRRQFRNDRQDQPVLLECLQFLATSSLKLPQFDGHLQLENVKESILWQESTTLWSIENRLSPW